MEKTKIAAETLRNVGISPKYKGYVYALYMLCLSMDDFTRVHNMTTQLYGFTCEKYNANPGAVERNIRFAIRRAWESDQSGAMHRLFQSYGIYYTPTNREFIAVLSDYMCHGKEHASMQLRMW
ncbi:MAG: sporulation initiation factor Spo0A C-terminal domain-containing protein [Eubacteriales bacterium]|nr:sporulation initiation factor Spo0A C-terminal domain-containing protein [Eubacteriales bacterium]